MPITLLKWQPRGRNRTGSRTVPQPFLNDEQWLTIADLLPHPPMTRKGGRPRILPRPCLEGVLWVLWTGAQWENLPERYPSPATCWRRLDEWTRSGVFLKAWRKLLGQLDRFRGLNWEEATGSYEGNSSRDHSTRIPELTHPKPAPTKTGEVQTADD